MKKPEHQAKHPRTSPGTKVQNAWSFTYTDPMRMYGVVLRNIDVYHRSKSRQFVYGFTDAFSTA
jgi:hypothetical protein